MSIGRDVKCLCAKSPFEPPARRARAANTRTSPPRAWRRSSTSRRSSALTETQKRRVIARLGPRVTAVAQDARSQTRNRELALERLRGV